MTHFSITVEMQAPPERVWMVSAGVAEFDERG